jgi:hypothetical protein
VVPLTGRSNSAKQSLSLSGISDFQMTLVASSKEFIIKMEGNTGEFLDISGSEIHGGRCVQSLPVPDVLKNLEGR